MPKVSVIVPVFNAEKTLRKCVESIIFGKEKDIEVILVEDYSKDNSWDLCLLLSKEYPQVKCLRNECNSGVSHTRNRGLYAATGQYIMFVDSDDWVSGDYARLLIDAHEKHPDMLCICEICFLDYTTDSRQVYGLHREEKKLYYFSPSDYFDLVDAVLLQSPCNKLFTLQVIREAGICFDETISMGEDFQFVIDYLKAASCTGCLVVNQPLYYYIRYGGTSLMSKWGDFSNLEKGLERLRSLQEICGDKAASGMENRMAKMKDRFCLMIACDSNIGKSEKLRRIEYVLQDGNAKGNYRRYKKILLRDRLVVIRNAVAGFCGKVPGIVRNILNKYTIKRATNRLLNREITIISQNCIGGVFYCDMGIPMQSPTVNLFMIQPDFIRFVNNLEHYLAVELEMHWEKEYPIGRLDDLTIHFMHYSNCKEARDAWNRRKQRVNFEKLLIVATDRNGFDDSVFDAWKKIPHPKILFTASKKYAEEAGSVFFPGYSECIFVPDLIEKREFYKDNALIDAANRVGGQIDGSIGGN